MSKTSVFKAFLVAGAFVGAINGSDNAALAASKAPLGYQLLCLKTPSECKGGGPSSVVATSTVMATLARVNSKVNAQIRPQNDGAADVWSVEVKVGDCEDYALTKRHELVNAGVPASSLRIAYVKTRSGEGHAILVVKTHSGDYVLDNLAASVKPLSQSGYRIISESGANPLTWS